MSCEECRMGLNCMSSELCFCYLAEGTLHNYNLHVHLTLPALSSLDAKGSHPILNDLGSAAFVCGMFHANISASLSSICVEQLHFTCLLGKF